MGTRAAFWIGDPRDIDSREWLGCIAFDGYRWSDDNEWSSFATEQEFRDAVDLIKQTESDFADPLSGGWPFPWADDVFLTDYTYAFFNGSVYYTVFYSSFVKIGHEVDDADDPSMVNIPAPVPYDRSQPDSIIRVSRAVNGRLIIT